MPGDYRYKEFTDEESRIYERSIKSIIENLNNGLTFNLACESLDIRDEELRNIIVDNALKVKIAEMHYGKNLTFDEISRILDVSIERLIRANEEMLEDVMESMPKTLGKKLDELDSR